VVLFLAGVLAACGGSKVKSEVIEFCTPIVATEENPPEAHVVVGPSGTRVPAHMADRFLLATEYPISTVDASAYAEAVGTSPPSPGTTLIKRMSFAVVDAQSMVDPADPMPMEPVVGRALFKNFAVLIQYIPQLGPATNLHGYDGVLGGDMLRRYAIRIHYAYDPECALPWTIPPREFPTVTFIQEFSEDDKELARDGYAVVDFGLSGGGTFVLGGQEIDFGATRVAVGACLAPQPFDPTAIAPAELNVQDATPVHTMDELEELVPVSGADAFLLVATGSQPLILGQQALERIQAVTGLPQSTSAATLQLQEGPVDARRASPGLPRVALIGDISEDLSPCGELARRRRIQWIRFWGRDQKEGTWKLNLAGAAMAIIRTPVDTYSVPDTSSLLQGIRFEMTPSASQIDGLIGHDYLHHYEFVLDYPSGRVILRCGAYTTPDATGMCPDWTTWETVDATGPSCCESGGQCYCPPANPCCQYPRALKP
jgi:hypothetical protein